MRRNETTRLAGFGLAAAAPAGLVLLLILRYGVDVPFWDQWDLAPFFEKSARGALTFSDLFSPQNEYRQLFPNLIFVGLGWLTGWDVRAEMLLNFLLACLTAWAVYRLGKITAAADWRQRPLPFLVSNLLIFSPMQYENWLFGVQVVYFMPVACVALSLLVAASGLGARPKALACATLATVATFSSANGILCWLVTPPALAAAGAWGAGGARWRWAAAWAAGLCVNAALYLYGFERLAAHPGLQEPLVRPLDAARYFLAFLGGPLAVGPRPLLIALPLGAALLTLLGAAAFYLWRRRDAALARRMTPWLMLGAFSVLTAALVTFGRAQFGAAQALSSRYTTFSLYLLVALAHLAP